MINNKFIIFYCRTSISVIYTLAILKILNNKKKKILILNKNKACIHPKFIKIIIKVIKPLFHKIYYVNFNNDHIKGNLIKKILLRNKNVINTEKLAIFKKLNALNIESYFGCGDEFDNAFFNSYKKNKYVNLCFMEHGYGNLINTIIFKPNLRNTIMYRLYKVFYFFNFLKLYPLNYKFFFGILGKNFEKNIDLYINNNKVKYIYIKNVIKEIRQLNKKIKFKSNIKKSVMINFSTLEYPKENIYDLDNLIDTTLKLINNRDYCYYTSHPRNKDKKKTILYVKRKLLKYKINLKFINYKSFNFLPAELIIYLMKTNKIISNLSSIPLNLSILDKKIKNYVFLDYSLNYPNLNHGPAHYKSCKKYYLKYFQKVKYI